MNIAVTKRPTNITRRDLRALKKASDESHEAYVDIKDSYRRRSAFADSNAKTLGISLSLGGALGGALLGQSLGGGTLPLALAGGVLGFIGLGAVGAAVFPDTKTPAMLEEFKTAETQAFDTMGNYEESLLGVLDDPELEATSEQFLTSGDAGYEVMDARRNVLTGLESIAEGRDSKGWKGEIARASHNFQVYDVLSDRLSEASNPDKYAKMFAKEMSVDGADDWKAFEKVEEALLKRS